MPNIGRKILSAFVEVTEEQEPVTEQKEKTTSSTTYIQSGQRLPGQMSQKRQADDETTEKFKQYFDKLFKDANLPGPDYFEFSKMTEAMISIPDERARYTAAFAGLSVQGLDKQKLLNTAAQYIQVLEQDASNFNTTVDAALKEKVQSKQQEIEAGAKRIEALSKEINDLQNKITLLQQEVKGNEEKIENNSGAYMREMQWMKSKMQNDVEKIKQFI